MCFWKCRQGGWCLLSLTASFAWAWVRVSWGRVIRSGFLRLAFDSRRKGARREFQLGAKLAHLAEALKTKDCLRYLMPVPVPVPVPVPPAFLPVMMILMAMMFVVLMLIMMITMITMMTLLTTNSQLDIRVYQAGGHWNWWRNCHWQAYSDVGKFTTELLARRLGKKPGSLVLEYHPTKWQVP